ncbi:MAG: HlyD family efflux transporter periplasmic adaptor subunit [Dethiobacter sp.]
MKRKRRFAVIPGKGKKKGIKEKFLRGSLMLVAAVLALQVAYFFAGSMLTRLLLKTVVSEESVLEQIVSVSGVIVRDERVVAAPVTGTVRWVTTAGARLATGANVAKIYTADGGVQNISAPVSGVMIPVLDGLEGALQPGDLERIDAAEVRKLSKKTQAVPDGAEVRQGSIFFKVVNNFSWYYVVDLSRDDFALLTSQRNRLRFAFSPQEEVLASWVVLKEGEDTVRLAFTLSEDVEGSFVQRLSDAEIVARRITGFVLPSSALISRGADTGVYLLEKSVVSYLPVKVLGEVGENVVIEGVRSGRTVIKNPLLVKEGQRL